jgi:hypothetical protein
VSARWCRWFERILRDRRRIPCDVRSMYLTPVWLSLEHSLTFCSPENHEKWMSLFKSFGGRYGWHASAINQLWMLRTR